MINYVATFTHVSATAHSPKTGWSLVPAKEEGRINRIMKGFPKNKQCRNSFTTLCGA